MGTDFGLGGDAAASSAEIRLERVEDLVNATRKLVRVMNAILAEDGIREDSWRILRLLSRMQGVSMGEISARLSLPTTSTTRLIDELSDASLVFRRGSSDDGRKALVHLSRDGAAQLRRVDAILSARLAELEREVPGIGARALLDALI